MAKAEFFVQFDGKIVNRGGKKVVDKARAIAITQSAPAEPKPGTIIAKMTIAIPDSAFIRLYPEIEVEIPEGHWTSAPVHVIVPDPEPDPTPAPARKKAVARRPAAKK